ncbi:hypothetical protein D3C76_1160420 [compost metagenome]
MCHERGPDGFAFGGRLDQSMGLQLIEHRDIGGGNALNRLRQQISAQLVGDCFTNQPEGVLGQPAGGTRLVEF